MTPAVPRRTLLGAGLGLGAATVLGPTLAGCGTDGTKTQAPPGQRRIAYGSGPDRYGWLLVPRHRPATGTVVLIHGGAWLPQYRADQFQAAAAALAAQGLVTWNIEYHRLSEGGGWPTTFEDAAAAIDRLGTLTRRESGVDPASLTRDVMLLGHSAGGQLAAWAASRTAETPGGPPRVRLRGAISLSGLLNLTAAAGQPSFAREVIALMGGTPAEVPERYRLGDPARLVPRVPVVAAHGTEDTTVSLSQTTSYVEAVRGRGAPVLRVDLPGDHSELPRPDGPAWGQILGLLRSGLGSR